MIFFFQNVCMVWLVISQHLWGRYILFVFRQQSVISILLEHLIYQEDGYEYFRYFELLTIALDLWQYQS